MAGAESDRRGGEDGTLQPMVKILVYTKDNGEAFRSKVGTITPG